MIKHKINPNLIILTILSILVFFTISCTDDITTFTSPSRMISISKWKYGKISAISFTFDDNNITNDSVAQIFNNNELSASFYFITDLMIQNKNKGKYSINLELYNNHEIASHSANHLNLTKATQSQLIYELKASKDSLFKWTNRIITSFAYPYGEFNNNIMNLTKTFYAFDRCYYFPYLTIFNNEKNGLNDNERALFTLDQLTDIVIKTQINKYLISDCWINFLGHSVGKNSGNYGYRISQDYLNNFLKEIKNNKNLWIDNFSNISLYKEIRDNSKIKINNNEVIIILDESVKQRFLDFEIKKMPITVEFHTNENINIIGTSIISIDKNDMSVFVTLDLFKNNSLTIQ